MELSDVVESLRQVAFSGPRGRIHAAEILERIASVRDVSRLDPAYFDTVDRAAKKFMSDLSDSVEVTTHHRLQKLKVDMREEFDLAEALFIPKKAGISAREKAKRDGERTYLRGSPCSVCGSLENYTAHGGCRDSRRHRAIKNGVAYTAPVVRRTRMTRPVVFEKAEQVSLLTLARNGGKAAFEKSEQNRQTAFEAGADTYERVKPCPTCDGTKFYVVRRRRCHECARAQNESARNGMTHSKVVRARETGTLRSMLEATPKRKRRKIVPDCVSCVRRRKR